MDTTEQSSLVVPVIDVQNDNLKELWPAIVLAMKNASFIAVDTELSGLGSRKALLAEDIEDRYKAILNAARTRSIISLGIACYKKLDGKASDSYQVQVYNLTLLCTEEYVIEPQSVQFLVQHGFDFNKQYEAGAPYYRGNDRGGPPHGSDVRHLFVELLRARKPLVLHNGLIDMVFLYQCFYTQLPDKLGNFTADLSEMFPAGIYDTKYATEYELRFPASYLEYAYKKCKLDNSRASGAGSEKPHVFLEFVDYADDMSHYIDYRTCPAVSVEDAAPPTVCQRFSAYGWCPNGSACALSHNTDAIIQQHEKSGDDKRKKRKRKRKPGQKNGAAEGAGAGEQPAEAGKEDSVDGAEVPEKKPCLQPDAKEAVAATLPAPETKPLADATSPVKTTAVVVEKEGNGVAVVVKKEGNGVAPDAAKMDAAKKKAEGGSHRAGFDAFMTGYIFCYADTLVKKEPGEEALLPACLNKLFLSGKSIPLPVVKSSFSKSTKAHTHKIEMVWGKGGK